MRSGSVDTIGAAIIFALISMLIAPSSSADAEDNKPYVMKLSTRAQRYTTGVAAAFCGSG
jgi:hypothetical protein